MELYGDLNLEDLEALTKIIKSSPYHYGSEFRDGFMNQPESMPRYNSLGEAALAHCLGKHYNPHTIPLHLVIDVRQMIKTAIQYKVAYRTGGYDWYLLTHLFKEYLSNMLNLDIPYDKDYLADESQWKFRAKFLNKPERPV